MAARSATECMTPIWMLPRTIMTICNSTSATRGDKSMPPTSGTTRRIGRNTGSHKRSITPLSGERVCTQDSTAFAMISTIISVTAMRSKPNTANSSVTTKPAAPPSSNVITAYCTSCARNAPSTQDKSHPPVAGMMRRNGTTSQSVKANTNCPTGLENGTRCACI